MILDTLWKAKEKNQCMYELTVIILKSWKTGILQKIADLKLDTIEKCYVNKLTLEKPLINSPYQTPLKQKCIKTLINMQQDI